MTTQLRTSTIRFSNTIKPREIEFFRGAVINTAELDNSLLFHNHTPNGLRYTYPLVQYKLLNNRAAVVGVGDGAAKLLWLKDYLDRNLQIGYKEMNFQTISIEENLATVGIANRTMRYTLSNWMPLNQKNHRPFHDTKNEQERIQMLEKILVGNILAFFKGVGFHADEQVVCHIEQRGPIKKTIYKKTEMKTLDIVFRTNAVLPNNLGLGKGSSLGHGTIQLA